MILKKNKFYLAPSLLSADFSNLKETLFFLKEINLNLVHFDVMDNHFVPNLTFGHKLIKDLRKHSDLIFDTHLMIDTPEKNIDSYIGAGCDSITFHVEACDDTEYLCNYIKKAGRLCGVSIKPNTEIKEIEPYLNLLDVILVMTVEPGFGGQSLIESTLPKIQKLKSLRESKGYHYNIECDGGINIDNVKNLSDLGMNIAVMGSAFFKQKNKKEFCEQVDKILDYK